MISKISKLESNLAIARKREELARAALAPKHKGGEWEEYQSASADVLKCERELASYNGEEYVEEIDFPVQWDTGAPLPQLFINDYKTFLCFYVREIDPGWDCTYVKVVDPKNAAPASLALVEFKKCLSAKLGSPNDEVFHGHPLEGKGLKAYTPLMVRNSSWVLELKNINKVHGYFKEEHWSDIKHYLFGFHDTTFECIADSFEVELHNMAMVDLMALVCKKMVE